MKREQKNLTPQQAYVLLHKKATKMGMSVSGYAKLCGVGRHVPSKWKHKPEGTITLEMATKLRLI